MKIKGAIFDLDGVLVDTARFHYLAWKEIADELGIEFTEIQNERLKGVSRMASLEILLEIGHKELSEQEKEELAEKKNRQYVQMLQKLTPSDTLSGARELPEVFLLGALGMGLRPEECVVFEDSVAGIEAGNTCGMYTVGVGKPEILKKADQTVPNLGEYHIN